MILSQTMNDQSFGVNMTEFLSLIHDFVSVDEDLIESWKSSESWLDLKDVSVCRSGVLDILSSCCFELDLEVLIVIWLSFPARYCVTGLDWLESLSSLGVIGPLPGGL